MMATNYLRPLFELMHKDILNNDIVLMDETTINVITNNRSQYYIWMINSSKYDIPILLYFFKESREYKNALEILDGLKDIMFKVIVTKLIMIFLMLLIVAA